MSTFNKKIFLALFLALFSTVTGMGIVVPLLPVYAESLGASGFYIAMIFGSFSISRAFLLPFFGFASDKRGRKPFIVVGLFLYSVVAFIFTLSDSIHFLIFVRFLHGIASAMIAPVVQAYIGDITPKNKEGFIMGVFNISMFSGLSLGPLLGGVIEDRYSLDVAFISMGVLSIIAFLLSLFMLPPTSKERYANRDKVPISIATILKDKDVIALFLYRTFYTICIGIIWCFLPIYAKSKINASSSQIGILITMCVLVNGFLQVPCGLLADKINKKTLMFIGSLVIAISLYVFKFTDSFSSMFFAAFLFGIGGGIAMPSLMALGVILGNKINAMAFLMSILTVGHSIGMFTGSILAGYAMDKFSVGKAFPMGSFVILIGFFLFFILSDKIE